MKVKLITYTPNPEHIVATAGKLCYSKQSLTDLYNNVTTEDIEKFITKLAELGHESPFEHVSFTFGIEGVSRALLAQITRHRLASYSVKSQRYVGETNFSFITPPSVKNKADFDIYNDFMAHAQETYDYLLQYIDKEDARMVLPNACTTQMVVTMNARSLINFFKKRCCNRAQWEIRLLADEMLKQCIEVAPTLFKYAGVSCTHGSCTEGKMTCGQPRIGVINE